MGTVASRALRREGAPEEPLEEPPAPPAPDPRLPLSARQLFNISKSWKGIARAMEPTGVTMFVRLFEENEDILHLFQKFQYKRLHELHQDSLELAQHASIVMSTLDTSMNSIDDVDRFMDHLHSVGRLHTRIPGFRRDYFWRIERPFLAAVQETLGERYTENMETIYKITIRYLLDTVVRGFDLASAQAPTASPEPSPTSREPSTEFSKEVELNEEILEEPKLPG